MSEASGAAFFTRDDQGGLAVIPRQEPEDVYKSARRAWEPTEKERRLEDIRRHHERIGMANVLELEKLINPYRPEKERTTTADVDAAFEKQQAIEKSSGSAQTRPGYFGPDNMGMVPPYATAPGVTDVQGSKQLHDDLFQVVWNQIIEPPIDLRLWASQLNRNTRLMRAIRSIARNTVGIGWEIVAAKARKEDEKLPPGELEAIDAELVTAQTFFDNCNDNLPFNAILELMSVDEEACGNGYLEFVRNNGGMPEKVFHVPAITVRLLRNDRGFVQVRGTRRRYFKRFGDPNVMDAETGAFTQEMEGGEAGLPIDKRASEVMHFALYSPVSDYYGIPRWLPAAAAVAGNALAAKRNLVFFKNDAVPRSIIAISGGTLDQDSKEQLQTYFDEGKGVEAAHRLLLLQAELEGVGVDEKSNVKIDVKPLTVGVGEDASFLKYRKANDEEIREALGLSEVFFSSGALAKASAVIAKAMTDEQELEPIRRLKEHLINHKVVKGGLGLKRVKFRFLRPQVMDTIERARADMEYAKIGVLTPNEIRQRSLGMDPLPKEQGWGHETVPMATQKQALKLALIQNSQNLVASFGEAIGMAISSAFGSLDGSLFRPKVVSEDDNPRSDTEGGSTESEEEDEDQTMDGDGRPKKNRGGGGKTRGNDTGQNENDRENIEGG